MMGLYDKIKDLFNAKKLHDKIDSLERELEAARGQVGYVENFREVSKSIDINHLSEEITNRVIDDFKPFMEQHALACLKQVFRDEHTRSAPAMCADMAYDTRMDAIQVRVRMDSLQTNFMVRAPYNY